MRVLVARDERPAGGWAAGQRVGLAEDEIHHLRVRRAGNHEMVQVLDGAGLVATGSLVHVGRAWMVDLETAEVAERPPPLALAVAAGDRERFSWMVEKCVELGVTRVVPLQTERTAGVATQLRNAHLGRLQRSALEAMKQCGVSWAPTIEEPMSLDAFLERPPAGSGWLADEHGDPTPSVLDNGPVTVMVGPEGGLTDEEREEAVGAGYRPMALGLYTLRFETAALAAAAAVGQARMRGQYG